MLCFSFQINFYVVTWTEWNLWCWWKNVCLWKSSHSINHVTCEGQSKNSYRSGTWAEVSYSQYKALTTDLLLILAQINLLQVVNRFPLSDMISNMLFLSSIMLIILRGNSGDRSWRKKLLDALFLTACTKSGGSISSLSKDYPDEVILSSSYNVDSRKFLHPC